jgi:multidrug efflux pump subunit AcrB
MAISAFNALTLTPALSALLLARGATGRGFLFRGFNRLLEGGTSLMVRRCGPDSRPVDRHARLPRTAS